MHWHRSYRADPIARPLADRHYNRQRVGARQFVPPGRCVVLVTSECDALWVTSWPFAEYTKHAWAGAWVNSTFRNEGSRDSSTLIRQAIAATRFVFGDPPALGFITFVDPSEVAGFFRRSTDGRTLEWGYAYWRVGFVHVGWTKSGLYAMQLRPEAMPNAASPRPPVGSLFDMIDDLVDAGAA